MAQDRQKTDYHITDWLHNGSTASVFRITSKGDPKGMFVSINQDGSFNLHDEDDLIKSGYTLYATTNKNYWSGRDSNKDLLPDAAFDKDSRTRNDWWRNATRNQDAIEQQVKGHFRYWPAAANALSPAHIDHVAADAKWQQKGIEKVDQSAIRAFYNSGHQYIAVPLVENAGNIGDSRQYKVFEVFEDGSIGRATVQTGTENGRQYLKGIDGKDVYEQHPSQLFERISHPHRALGNLLGEYYIKERKGADGKIVSGHVNPSGEYAHQALMGAGLVSAQMSDEDREHLKRVGGVSDSWISNLDKIGKEVGSVLKGSKDDLLKPIEPMLEFFGVTKGKDGGFQTKATLPFLFAGAWLGNEAGKMIGFDKGWGKAISMIGGIVVLSSLFKGIGGTINETAEVAKKATGEDGVLNGVGKVLAENKVPFFTNQPAEGMSR